MIAGWGYENDQGRAFALIPIPTGDLNGDGFVGHSDLGIVLDWWGQTVTPGVQPDPTGDGFVGQFDLDLVLGHWGEGALPTNPVPEPATLAIFVFCGLVPIASGLRRKPTPPTPEGKGAEQ
jgi:hypothetical protein